MDNREIIESLKKKRDEFQKKINSIDETIELLEYGISNDNNSSDGYESEWSYKDKIEFFLKREQRFLFNREMAEFAHEKEPNISITDFANKFSNVLSRLKDENQLISIKIGKSLKSTIWGSPKWIDSTGDIIKDYSPNENYYKDKEKNKIEI